MESVKVRIDGDADYGFKFTAVIPTIPKKVALYISTKKSLWLMDYDRALGVIEDYGENCLSAMMLFSTLNDVPFFTLNGAVSA